MVICYSSVGCEALVFVCRDGERKEHPKYCDEYYFCVRGKYIRKKCIYPDRWSIEHGQCERFHFVSCGKRVPKNHPCKYNTSSHKRFSKNHPCKYISSPHKRIPKNHPCKYNTSSHKRFSKNHPCKYIYSSNTKYMKSILVESLIW